MAFPNYPGDPPIQSLLNIGVGNFRLATGIIPAQIQQVQAPGFAAHTLEQARIQELEAARAIGMEQRVRLMLESRAQQAAAAELAFRNETIQQQEVESSYNDSKGFRGDRREKDRDRDGRHRDDRDRGRDRDRRRFDDRSRWNDQDGGRDRSRHGRDRSNNRDRSPVRGGRSDEDYGSQGDRAYDDDRDRHRNRDGDNRGDGEKWVTSQPSRTIILRGLNQEVDSKMIGAELMVLGLPVKEIRLIRSASGVSRGFAFVEFHNAEDAKRWMDHTQGSLLLQNQYRAYMDYSFKKERQGPRDLQRNDWVCYKCMAHNFKRRDYCYNCNLPRKESEKNKTPDGQDEIGTNPCNTLIFRGLDALTTEEGLVTALNQALPSSLAPIKNIAIIRDELNTSRGFGFVEFHSVAASTQMLDALSKMDPLLEVDGKQLMINYAKNSFNTTMATIQQQQSSQYYDYYQQQQQSGQYYDPHTQQYYDYSQYYNNQGTSSAASPGAGSATASTTATKGNSTNAAAAVAQAAIQQAQAHKNYHKQPQTSASSQHTAEYVTVNGVEYPIYPPPDTSSYQYDETSGYYYDPLTQLYYDANSQYYYNSTTGHYMYWDAEKSTYLPAPSGADDTGASAGDDKGKKDGKDKKDKEKTKMAKKIAKDMEKWAKSMNAQKDAMKGGSRAFGAMPASGLQESATADAGFAMLTRAKEDKSLMPPPPLMGGSDKDKQAPPGSKPGLVASYGGDSDSGDEDESAPIDESKLVDWTKLACLLCKRQFQSKEILNKHTQFSDLHKQNLEQLNLSRSASSADKIEYRDRAKERRQKYGAPEPPEPRKRKGRDFGGDSGEAAAPVPFEEPTKFGIGGENIGNKLLQKMGWSKGQGLGKANQGRTDPIAAERRNASAGLGARGGKVVAEAGDSYREALKKTMYARYNEMD